MGLFSRRKKIIPDGKCRIIKLDKDALFELIYETIIDNQKVFFDVSDVSTITTHFAMDWDSGELICIAKNLPDSGDCSALTIDAKALLTKFDPTTKTIFDDHRYIEISEKDIRNL